MLRISSALAPSRDARARITTFFGAISSTSAHQGRRRSLKHQQQKATRPVGNHFLFGHASQPSKSARPLSRPLNSVDPWQTLAVLSTCAAAAQLLDSHTRWGALLSAPLLALLAALGAAAAGLLPAVSPVYDVVWAYLMPLAVGLFLLEHDLSALAARGGQVLAAFLLGAGGMVAGAFVAWQLLGATLGPAGPQLAAAMVASYIGGNINMAAVAAATQLPAALVPSAIAADNLAMLVLLAGMMAVPARVINAWGSSSQSGAAASAPLQPALAGTGAGSSSSSASMLPTRPRTSSSMASSSNKASAVLGLDGSPLETQPPSEADVAGCLQASSQGRRGGSSCSSSSSSPQQLHASVTTGDPQRQQQGRQQAGRQQPAGRAVGQLALDGAPLLTPDPDQDMKLQQQQQQTHTQQQQEPRHTTSAAAAAAAIGAAGAAAASPSAAAVQRAASSCGGCRASGVTALDDNPLLTAAPGMGDAISTINAARTGRQQLLVGNEPGQQAPAAGAGAARQPADLVPGVGCGCCDEALDAIAAASRPPGSAASADGGGSSGVSLGALALDNSPLLTEEPDRLQLEVAVVAARSAGGAGGRSGQVISVSESVSSSLSSSDSEEDFELLVRLSWKELQQRLEEQQQRLLEQEQQAAAAPAAAAAVVPATTDAAEQQEQLAAVGSASGPLTGTTAAAALAAAVVAAAASRSLAAALGAPSLQLLLLSGCALGLSVAGNAAHKALVQRAAAAQAAGSVGSPGAAPAAAGVVGLFSGSSQLGQLLMGLFFATLGGSCCVSLDSLAATAPLMGFVGVMVAVHWLLLAGLGPLLQLPGPVLVAGSIANIGGPAAAAGLVGGRGWPGLVQPALLCGSLGYALGTAAGLLVARGLGAMPV